MAERRYGFRFSFAEGCVIVVSMIGASFLVFLFGMYAGRELAIRKATETTHTVRVNNIANEDIDFTPPGGNETAARIKEQGKSDTAPHSLPETPQTVVVVTPQRTDERTALPHKLTPPPPPSEKKTLAQVEIGNAPPVVENKNELLSLPTTRVAQETKSVGAKIAAPSQKTSTAKGRWSVQVHASRDEGAARRLASQLRSQGYLPVVSKGVRDGNVWYRVRVGSFASADEARASVGRFRREGKFSQAYPVLN